MKSLITAILLLLITNLLFAQVPTITSFTPSTAGAGTTITITGTNFYSSIPNYIGNERNWISSISIGGMPVDINYGFNLVNATTITAIVPIGATNGNVSVTTMGGTASKGGFSFCGTNNPSVSFSAGVTNLSYGSPVSFTATVKNAGTNPLFQYSVNGHIVQGPVYVPNSNTGLQLTSNGSNQFTSNYLQNGDMVTCQLTANANCLITDTISCSQIVSVSGNNPGGWADVGNLPLFNSSGSNLVLSPANIPFIYFMDVLHQSKGTVKMYNGSQWINVGDSASLPAYADIAFSPTGILYVAGFTDTSTQIKVMRYVSGAWQQVGSLAGMPYNCSFPKLSFTKDGTPYIGFTDYNSNSNNLPNVMKFDGSNWVHVGNPDFYAAGTNWFDFKIAPNNTPYVLFGDMAAPRLGMSCYKFNGSSWVLVGPMGFSTAGDYVSLAFDTSGIPYACGVERALGANHWRTAVFANTGNTWNLVGGNYINTDSANYPRLVFSASNTPVVSYFRWTLNPVQPQNNALVVYNYTKGSWNQLGKNVSGLISAYGPPGLAVTSDNSMIYTVYSPVVTSIVRKFILSSTTISSINPTTGPVGTLVTITGSNLSNPSVVSIGGITAIPISNNGNTLVAMVMPGAKTGTVSLTTPGGAATCNTNFTVTPTRYPAIQQGNKLVGSGYKGTAQEGNAVALSADGNTAVIGGNFDNAYNGALWVYTRSGATWTQQGSKLIASDNAGAAWLGYSVAISADGNTIISGGIKDNFGLGAAWVFTRSSGVWIQQGTKLVGTGSTNTTNIYQGYSVGMSADGNTAIIGGFGDNHSQGAAWIFSRSNGTWSQQSAKLIGTGAVGVSYQGHSVGLSADGNTAIVGGNYDNSGIGAVWIYTRNGSTWMQQGSKLFGTGNTGNADMGTSVALSADGNTAIAGGAADNNGMGAAWVFTRNAGTWSQQGNKLVGTGGTGTPIYEARAVTISADGNTVLFSGYGDNNNQGAVWAFTRNNGIWTQMGNKIAGAGSSGAAEQGYSLAISADGTTGISGAMNDNSAIGAAWVFVAGNPSFSITGTLTSYKTCSGMPSAVQSFTVKASQLTGNIIITAANGFEFSNSATGKYGVTDTLVPVSGAIASATVYIRLSSTATGTPAGNITITSAGATTQTIAISGTVNPLPTIPAITNTRPLSFCNGDSTILTSSVTTGIQWQLNNTNITGATGTKITAKQSGAYTVVTTNSNGCSAVSAITTVKNNPIPGAPLISTSGNATAFCTGSYLVLSSDSASGNQWYYNGTAVTTAKGVNDTARAAGNYALQYTSSAGCISPLSTAKAITVNAQPSIPTISSKGSTSFCQGLYDILVSSSSTGNQWKLNGTAIAKSSTSQNFVANVSGNYSVTVSNAAGCTATSTVTAITVIPQPAKPMITEDANQNLVSSSSTNNQWYSQDEALIGDTGHVYTPWLNGNYTVQAIQRGCISPMSEVFVYNNPNLNKESIRMSGTSTLDSKAVQLYPNPVGSTLKISYQISGIQNVTAEIMDMNGNIIARKESITSGSSIDVSAYASGMYIIRLVNGENQEVLYTTKVIKAK